MTRDISIYRYVEPFWMFTGHGTTVMWIGLGDAAAGDGLRQKSVLPVSLSGRRVARPAVRA